jgi:hypothetical protein
MLMYTIIACLMYESNFLAPLGPGCQSSTQSFGQSLESCSARKSDVRLLSPMVAHSIVKGQPKCFVWSLARTCGGREVSLFSKPSFFLG